MINVQVFRERPLDFTPTVEVSNLFIEHEGAYLHLKRSEHVTQKDTWCLPGGKLEKGESPIEGLFREVREETNLTFKKEEVKFIGSVDMRLHLPDTPLDYVMHVYDCKVARRPAVLLSKEHTDHKWLTFEELNSLPLIKGHEKLTYFFREKQRGLSLTRKPFYFLRHGAFDLPEDLKVEDHTSLNAKGIEQSSHARSFLDGLAIEKAYYSPLKRTVETKDILLRDTRVKESEVYELKECSLAIWLEIMKFEAGLGLEITQEINEFIRQVVNGVNYTLSGEETPLIISHGGVHWALCYLMQLNGHPWKVDYCNWVRFNPVKECGWEAKTISELTKT